MFDLSLADDGLQARFDALPGALMSALSTKASALAQALVNKVRDEKLSGEALHIVSGALRGSIVSDVAVEESGVSASVGTAGDLPYAAIQEYGGKTAAHEILPTKADALAFVIGGQMRFAKRVEHPGSAIPERSYLRSSLAEMADEIISALGLTPREAWEVL